MHSPINTIEMTTEVLTNIKNITTRKATNDQKCSTFEGDLSFVKETSCSAELKIELLRSCKEIDRYILRHSGLTLRRGSFYFKVDPLNVTYLIYATDISLDTNLPYLNGSRGVVIKLKPKNPNLLLKDLSPVIIGS